MKKIAIPLVFITLISFTTVHCFSQEEENKTSGLDRQAVFAGKFYDSDPQKLQLEIKNYFKKAKPGKDKSLLAIISPHAGYIFSGQIAASAYSQIDPDREYQSIFILAPSHYYAFNGAAVYNQGSFITPLGRVEVDIKVANELIKNNPLFKVLPESHAKEHSIEVQLPYLQIWMKKKFKIVPILIGTQEMDVIEKIAHSLKPYLNERNLFIISSDFSHYPSSVDATRLDMECAQIILKKSPVALKKYIQKTSVSGTKGLATSMCGEAGILCLLEMSSKMKDIEYQLIDYINSGDTEFGDKNKVVGYWAISLVKKTESTNSSMNYFLTKEDKEELLKIARKSIEEYITKNQILNPDTNKILKNLKTKCGAFVTLTKNGELRGCIGSFSLDQPLYKEVIDMAIAASANDPRFDKVKTEELENLEIEISVLTPMRKIDSISQIEIGKHGIYIKNGHKRGVLLPQVALKNGWSPEEFVNNCAVYKAGIPKEEVENSELFIYEAIVFKENEIK